MNHVNGGGPMRKDNFLRAAADQGRDDWFWQQRKADAMDGKVAHWQVSLKIGFTLE